MKENLPHFTVSKISEIIKNTLEETFSIVNIIGEVSNLSISKKYAFFSLKDSSAVLRCVSWSPESLNIEEGDSVVATGKISVYKGSSSYQLTVYRIEKYGIGNLAKAFYELKVKLEKQGIFDIKHKKPIPKFVQKIAVISAENSAALEDIIVNLRESIVAETHFIPAMMQGKSCVSSVMKALHIAEKLTIDAILIARGGGSFEDLNEFNNEALALEVFACKIPIISAIGHETDFTILDFVADLRMPTPTAGAKIISPQKQGILLQLQALERTIDDKVAFEIMQMKKEISFLEQKIEYLVQNRVLSWKNKLENIAKMLDIKKFQQYFNNLKAKLNILETKMESLNPEKTLKRGFALLQSNGKIYENPALLPQNFEILTKYGKINAKKLDK